jgi:hypothetical protein
MKCSKRRWVCFLPVFPGLLQFLLLQFLLPRLPSSLPAAPFLRRMPCGPSAVEKHVEIETNAASAWGCNMAHARRRRTMHWGTQR